MAKEYIEREAVTEQIRLIYCKDCNSYNGVRCRACEFDDAMSLVEDAPAADVVEVKHGEWLLNGRCSNCLENPLSTHRNYCPNCGAKMDGERKETK